MIESDAPWCDIRKSHAGHPLIKTHYIAVDKAKYRAEENVIVKSRNEPLATRQVLEIVADLHNIPVDEAAEMIYLTSTKIFS
jgi:TatD DNase family protein